MQKLNLILEDSMKISSTLFAVLVIILATSSCARHPEISIEDAWARPGFQGDNSAVYLTINNGTDQGDGLIGAVSDVANLTEVHLSKMDADGTMTMERQDLVGIPANKVVELSPGGLHVMLVNLVQDLNVGDTFRLTLNFQRAGDIEVEVEVKQPE
jgi:copper(I)-binding protein